MGITHLLTKTQTREYDGGMSSSILLPEGERRIYFKARDGVEKGPFKNFSVRTRRVGGKIEQTIGGIVEDGPSLTFWKGEVLEEDNDSLRAHVAEFAALERSLKNLSEGRAPLFDGKEVYSKLYVGE